MNQPEIYLPLNKDAINKHASDLYDDFQKGWNNTPRKTYYLALWAPPEKRNVWKVLDLLNSVDQKLEHTISDPIARCEIKTRYLELVTDKDNGLIFFTMNTRDVVEGRYQEALAESKKLQSQQENENHKFLTNNTPTEENDTRIPPIETQINLINAIKSCDIPAIDDAVRQGANINTVISPDAYPRHVFDNDGVYPPPLIVAIETDDPTIIDAVINNGAKLHPKYQGNIIPLLHAIHQGCINSALSLVKKGVAIHSIETKELNALDYFFAQMVWSEKGESSNNRSDDSAETRPTEINDEKLHLINALTQKGCELSDTFYRYKISREISDNENTGAFILEKRLQKEMLMQAIKSSKRKEESETLGL